MSVIASTDMSPFFSFFFRSLSPVVFPKTERNFDASSSAAVISSNSQFFSIVRKDGIMVENLVLFLLPSLSFQ